MTRWCQLAHAVAATACAFVLAACGRHPASARGAHDPARAAAPASVAGDAVAFRFLDHVTPATRSGPPLADAWQRLSYPAKLVSPYGGLHGDDAFSIVELALADADVASYGKPHTQPRRAPLVRFDPVWNRTRAVYESKTALFAVAGTQYAFDVPAVARGTLETALALPPDAGPMDFVVEVDGHEVFRRTVARRDAGAWLPIKVDTAGAHKIVFRTDGDAGAVAAWGNPLLIAHGDRRPAPNVLFIIVDTLRRDALPVMPRVRRLADEGAAFDQAITAATWTRPSVIAMLGGDLPTALGLGAEDMIPSDAARRRFYEAVPLLLPRLLEAHGYRASAIGNNFFLLGYPQIGLSLGFDEVADIRHPVLDTPAITNAAIAFLEEHRDEPWLLHLHYDAPHWPYTPPPQYLRALPRVPFPDDELAPAYLAEAAYADDYVGRVLDALDRLGLTERTLVVLVGDHGEVFDHAHQHIVEKLGQPTLHHHGWSGYDELLRVPLILRLPGVVPAARIPSQVSLIDLEPTIRELLGIAPREGARGRSLAPLWRGAEVPERPAFTEGQNVRVVRAGGWAYLRRDDGHLTLPGGARVLREEALYDLGRDPLEHVDRSQAAPAMLARMRVLFAREAPVARDGATAVVHLRVAPSEQPHVVEGTLRSDGALALRAIAGGEATPVDAHTIRLALHGAATVDFAVDPPNARLELTLRRDGTRLEPGEILVGPYALPLAKGQSSFALDGAQMSWLDASTPPVLGDRGELLLWRDPSRLIQLSTPGGRGGADEVAGMMRRWGYAQPGR